MKLKVIKIECVSYTTLSITSNQSGIARSEAYSDLVSMLMKHDSSSMDIFAHLNARFTKTLSIGAYKLSVDVRLVGLVSDSHVPIGFRILLV